MQAISPSVHSLSFLYLVRFQIQQAQKRSKRDIPDDLLPGGILWKQAVRFLRSFDPIQIRYAGLEWRQLVELVASAAQATFKASVRPFTRHCSCHETNSCVKPVLAVKVIRDALERLDSSGIFTSVHLLLVKLALLTSSYTYALPIVDKLLSHFPTDTEHAHGEMFLCSQHESSLAFLTDASGFSAKLTYRDHLLFFLYSAMIYMALKKWDQASHCLCAVISSPTTNSISKIMVEAYKKLILANLLGHGKVTRALSCYINGTGN
jgi:COP9 signalosome complex subunit 3